MDKKTFFLGIIFILSGTHNSIMIIVNTVFIILASLFLIIKNKLVKNSNKNEKANENKIINLLGEVKRSKSANNLNHVYLDKGIFIKKDERTLLTYLSALEAKKQFEEAEESLNYAQEVV